MDEIFAKLQGEIAKMPFDRTCTVLVGDLEELAKKHPEIARKIDYVKESALLHHYDDFHQPDSIPEEPKTLLMMHLRSCGPAAEPLIQNLLQGKYD